MSLIRLLIAVLACAWVTPLAAEDGAARVPQSREEVKLSFAPVVKRVSPAVVSVRTRTKVQGRDAPSLSDDPFFRRFFGDQGAPQRGSRVAQSLGSGVIVDPTGLVVTNNHVVKDASEIVVVLADRREIEARLELADERTDLAILKLDMKGERLPAVSFADSDDLEVGDFVLAMGNPFGVGQTVTSGIISALARTTVGIADYRFFIQTDAAINPGNSGGALIDLDGRLVGINTAIYSRSGGSLGIGFAIPANMVRVVMGGLHTGGHVVRPWLGASTKPVTADIAPDLGLTHPEGVLVSAVTPDSPAARAGLKPGDVVVAVERRSVDDAQALRFRIATLPIGGTARLAVLRRGQPVDVSLRLEAPPEVPLRNPVGIEGQNPFAGTTVADLSPALAEELGIDGPVRGVVVMDVRRSSIALRFGVRPHDIITRVDDGEPLSVAALQERLKLHEPGTPWRVGLRRGVLTVNLQGGQ